MRFAPPAIALSLVLSAPLHADDVNVKTTARTTTNLNTNSDPTITPTLGVGGVGGVNTINTQTGGSDFRDANGVTISPQATGPNGEIIQGTQITNEGRKGVSPSDTTGAISDGEGAGPTSDREGNGPATKRPVGPKFSGGAPQKEPKPEEKTETAPNFEKTVQKIRKGGGDADELGHVFDAAHKYGGKVGGPRAEGPQGAGVGPSAAAISPAAMSRLSAPAKAIVNRVLLVANDRGTHPSDVPGLFLGGIDEARKAAEAGIIPKEEFSSLKQVFQAEGAEKAKVSLAEVATAAYEAAAQGDKGAGLVERIVGPRKDGASDMPLAQRKSAALDQWQELLGAPGKPLISNLERLKKDVWRAQQEAAKSASPPVASRVVLKPQNGAYFAALPNSSIGLLPELAADLPVGPSLESPAEADLAEYKNDPSLTNTYRAAKGRAGLMPAVAVWVASAVMRAWEWVWEGYLSLTGRGPAQTLAKLSRPPLAEESALVGALPVTFVDFAAINGPYLAAQQVLSSPGAPTIAQAENAFAQAERLARASAGVTFSGAGPRFVKRLRGRLARQTAGYSPDDHVPAAAAALLNSGEGGDLSSWLDKLRESAFARLDAGAQAKLAAQSAPFLVYADLSGTAPMIRVYFKKNGLETAAGLKQSGFHVESAGGSAVAVFDHESGSDGEAALNGALTLLASKKSESETAIIADTSKIDETVAAYLGHTGKNQLAELEKADPGLSGFAPADIVEKGSRGFLVGRQRKRLGGRIMDLVLLRDLSTRRALFGQAYPIPAH